MAGSPASLITQVPNLSAESAYGLAQQAVDRARAIAPKSSGKGAKGLYPVWGPGYYGVGWSDAYMWYQEAGVSPFTMRSLAGKTIPMWVSDPTGALEATIAPKDRVTRVKIDASGKKVVKIFRKAAKLGATKQAVRKGVVSTVPASYPGAPGRIALRQTGQSAGKIARTNVGVRWRFPGLVGRGFMHKAVSDVAYANGLGHLPVTPSTLRSSMQISAG